MITYDTNAPIVFISLALGAFIVLVIILFRLIEKGE